ncbi:histidine kinase [Streptomyces sp. RY43-2]|uniref:histidine kinase n=1 Tax=Streptomyces macrolidinus TaxID=2952607 RepID=A0ABT0ZLQ4_9ACTN|nr:histidine kinase [Streptomyces macrolidinus]MCN9244529.1 histidine kinase [Streptomyces macrolidinus]
MTRERPEISHERPRWTSRTGALATAVVVVLLLSLVAVGSSARGAQITLVLVPCAAVAVSVWAMARTRTQRTEYERRLTTWAAERAAQAERLRIARDLHDLVSHGIGLITVRAATAQATGQEREELATALGDIEDVSRQTTTELRRMLTVLREPAATGDAAPLRPAESFADLPAIVAAAERTGLTVRVRLDCVEPARVSAGVQLATCAVAREALHNALRHAGPTITTLTVRADGDDLLVRVEDEGPVPGRRAGTGAGHGLSVLRDRVQAVGGALTAAPCGPGFRVEARFPREMAR